MTTPVTGSDTIGSLASPITFGLSESGPTWTKTFSLDISSTGIAPGAQIAITEHLMWSGAGASPFTDWHQTILSTDFIWQSGVITVGTPSTGTISGGGKDIDFSFGPQTSAVAFDVLKTAVYNGPLLIPSPGATVSFQVVEQPSIPEPEATAFVCGCGLMVWVIGRRCLRLV